MARRLPPPTAAQPPPTSAGTTAHRIPRPQHTQARIRTPTRILALPRLPRIRMPRTIPHHYPLRLPTAAPAIRSTLPRAAQPRPFPPIARSPILNTRTSASRRCPVPALAASAQRDLISATPHSPPLTSARPAPSAVRTSVGRSTFTVGPLPLAITAAPPPITVATCTTATMAATVTTAGITVATTAATTAVTTAVAGTAADAGAAALVGDGVGVSASVGAGAASGVPRGAGRITASATTRTGDGRIPVTPTLRVTASATAAIPIIRPLTMARLTTIPATTIPALTTPAPFQLTIPA